MRKIGAFNEEQLALDFVQRLQDHNITSLVEEEEGNYLVWVHEEGDIEKAKKLYAESASDLGKKNTRSFDKKKFAKKKQAPKPEIEVSELFNKESFSRKKPPRQEGIAFFPYITRSLLGICVFIFIMGVFQTAKTGLKTRNLSSLPSIAKALIIDYPENDKILGELIDRYGLEKVKNNTLPKEAELLIKRYNNTVSWVGIYNIVLLPDSVRGVFWKASIFSDVRRGEIWRLFTPAVLHTGLLHILFNMLWLGILGKMVEFNMGRIKFAIFVLLTALISNCCQYFMSGPYFMGISGVLSAFIGYILVRRKTAPWEIYFLAKETLNFFLIFIFGFFVLQVVAFFLQYFNIYTLPVFIANTGHISGLLSGMILAKWGIFAKKII